MDTTPDMIPQRAAWSIRLGLAGLAVLGFGIVWTAFHFLCVDLGVGDLPPSNEIIRSLH